MLLEPGWFNGDYRELLELVVHIFRWADGETTKKGQPKLGFKMIKPGAFYHARFLAKSLYILKIAMLMDNL